jgi:uncharacterized protein (DUF697 family)
MNFFRSITKIVSDAGEAIGSAASHTGQAVLETAVGIGEAVGGATVQATQTVVKTAVGTGEVIGTAASHTGQAVVGTATGIGEAVGSAAGQVTQAVVKTAVGTGEVIGTAASYAGQTVVGTATGIGEAVGSATGQATQAVVKTAVGTGEVIGTAASQATQVVVETTIGTGEAIGTAASYAGQAVVGTAVGFGQAVGGAASQAGQAIVETAIGAGGAIGIAAEQATNGVGYAITFVGNNPQFQQVTQFLQVDWLVRLIDQVDLVKAETLVRRLQQQYPNEQPSEIAHRLIVDKALLAGGTGFASSLVPGAAVALLAADFTAIMLLQAEMVYQIACAYGLDLQEPARKGEILAIFGLSLGSSQILNMGVSYAAKAGLSVLQNVPVAGAVIGASTNAVMLYALGYGACRFYEAKLHMVPLLPSA